MCIRAPESEPDDYIAIKFLNHYEKDKRSGAVALLAAVAPAASTDGLEVPR